MAVEKAIREDNVVWLAALVSRKSKAVATHKILAQYNRFPQS
jgi:hypothetical protein